MPNIIYSFGSLSLIREAYRLRHNTEEQVFRHFPRMPSGFRTLDLAFANPAT